MARYGGSSSEVVHSPWVERLLRFDWILLGTTLFLVSTGIFMVHSIDIGRGYGLLIRQITAAGVGLIGMVVLALLPYQIFRIYVRPLYFFMIFLLLFVLFFGTTLRGTRGWFHIGPVYLQSVEVAKLFFIMTLGGYLDQQIPWFYPRSLVAPFLLAMFPIGLILIQPDLSSSLVFFPVALIMLYVAGARTLHLLAICLVCGLSVGIPLVSTYFKVMAKQFKDDKILLFFSHAFQGGWESLWLFLGVCALLIFIWWFMREMHFYVPSIFLWVTLFLIGLGTVGAIGFDHTLKDYQRKRLIAFINPNIDPLDSGYNVRQSQIAIGSGRMMGKGFGKGSQSRLGFLPSQHTDFIFSAIGEELGFFGAIFVMAGYFLIIWRAFDISTQARDRFGSLVAIGVGSMFAFYFVLNIGMAMGIAPVAGVPLPMLSYGGSSVASSMWTIGLLLSVHWRRFLL